jgi:pimeloyl-ACP methyl ester carboxylesterase
MQGFIRSTLRTRDGVRLALFDRPHRDPSAPVIFLSNGLGGNLTTWKHVIGHFGPSFRVVSWDYRGLYASRFEPGQKGRVPIDVPTHVADAVEVLDHFDIQGAVFIGWSMGVQLNFDLARHVVDRMDAIIGLAGGFGRTLSTTFLGKRAEALLRPGIRASGALMTRLQPVLGKLAGRPVVLELAKRLGVVSRTLDDSVVSDLVQDWQTLDLEVLHETLVGLGDHDAEDVLPGLQVPTLIVVGDRDPMTPPSVSEHIVGLLPKAELEIIEGGSHFMPIEYPARLNRRIETFLRHHTDHFGEAEEVRAAEGA